MASTSEEVATFLPLGAIIQAYRINGENIVQGFPTAEDYKAYNAPYFGETIGRIANRISGAKIKHLNGKEYELAANNGPNSLHGGKLGWGKRVWDGPEKVTRNGKDALLFKYLSKDGEEGFPGTVEARVWYITSTEEENGVQVSRLEMEYEAELVGDEDVQETAVGMTNHSYFNLTMGPSIEGTEVTLSTSKYQEVDGTGIPTGPISSYPGITAGKPFTLGASEPDIDDCFIANESPSSIPVDTRSLPLQSHAKFYHPASNRHLEVLSTEPAFQFYTGKYIDVPAVAGLPARSARSAFCVEPSRYVNAVNVEQWKGMVVLKRGQKYGSRIVYKGWEGSSSS